MSKPFGTGTSIKLPLFSLQFQYSPLDPYLSAPANRPLLAEMTTTSSRFLVINGVVSQTSDVPPISSFLETHPGAYTTTRTHNNATSILFWERHLRRLAESTRILSELKPDFLFGSRVSSIQSTSSWESFILPLANDSLKILLPIALKEKSNGQELAITTLVSGNQTNLNQHDEDRVGKRRTFSGFDDFDVYMHVGMYVPPAFGAKQNAAHLAVVGRGREVAMAKSSEWVRIRKGLENLRPPSTTELLLSNDGDHILEGCITNFFVVCRKENTNSLEESLGDSESRQALEVQTAPLRDGVLPGVIRQVVIEVCLARGIPLREVAPSWSEHELWEEAFITNSLRLVQHVECIQIPSLWEALELKTLKEVAWEEKCFKEGPGIVTAEVQREVVNRGGHDGHPCCDFA